MSSHHLIPIVLFICIAYAIKSVVDARVRSKLIAANSSEELIRSMLVSEQRRRRYDSLRFGIVFICLAVGFALVEAVGWDNINAGTVAILLGATGMGELVFYWTARKLESLQNDTRREAPFSP